VPGRAQIKPLFPCALIFFAGCAVNLLAQDTRKVAEPQFPKPCVKLDAQLSAPGGALSDEDERKLDTERIQNALDHCKKGHAVELRAVGGHNVFLAAPLYLRTGVTLRIDANTALFASRNPRDYDVTPGSCGVVDQAVYPCRSRAERGDNGRWRH
jgi:polygalacturonase